MHAFSPHHHSVSTIATGPVRARAVVAIVFLVLTLVVVARIGSNGAGHPGVLRGPQSSEEYFSQL